VDELLATWIDDAKLKDLLRTAVVEALHEHRDLVKDSSRKPWRIWPSPALWMKD
jgi:hypothetical protein